MKVLIISHNPITDYNNMGKTLKGLFGSFPHQDLCQLYVYPTLPNVVCCNSYYRITDKEAFRGIIRRKKVGRVIETKEIKNANELYENRNDENLYRNKQSNRELKILARDWLWSFSNWYCKRLKNWLMEQKPTVIFVAPGASKFLYNVALKISKRLCIPIVSYICDDFYFSSKKIKGILKKYYGWRLRSKIRKLLVNSSCVVTICDELNDAYTEEFSCKCITISTGANIPIEKEVNISNNNNICYFGNLKLKRHRALAEVARAIDNINKTHKIEWTLNIYTADDLLEMEAEFEDIKCAKFCGFIGQEEMYRKMKEATVLLHVESFESAERVKYSVSTKIADILASGCCLFAYGPRGVASIEHLKRNDCATVVNERSEIERSLLNCIQDEKSRKIRALNGLNTAKNHHDSLRQSELLKNALLEVCNENITSECRL